MNANEFNSVIDKLAEKFGVAADKIYPMLLKQAYIDGYMALGWTIIAFAITALSILFWYKCISYVLRKEAKEEKSKHGYPYDWEEFWTEDPMRIVWAVVMSLLGLIFFFVFLCNIHPAIRILNNPEWYAWEKIFSVVGK